MALGLPNGLFPFNIPVLFPNGIPAIVFAAIVGILLNALFLILPPSLFGVKERENINLIIKRLPVCDKQTGSHNFPMLEVCCLVILQ